MKKLFVIALIVAVFTASGSVFANKLAKAELNPMVLVELEASLKADLIMAELYLTWDIRDELESRSTVIISDEVTVESTVIINNEFPVQNDWSVAAQD